MTDRLNVKRYTWSQGGMTQEGLLLSQQKRYVTESDYAALKARVDELEGGLKLWMDRSAQDVGIIDTLTADRDSLRAQLEAAKAPADYEALRQLRQRACKAWRHDLTRQQALDVLHELKELAQDSYAAPQLTAQPEGVAELIAAASAFKGMNYKHRDYCRVDLDPSVGGGVCGCGVWAALERLHNALQALAAPAPAPDAKGSAAHRFVDKDGEPLPEVNAPAPACKTPGCVDGLYMHMKPGMGGVITDCPDCSKPACKTCGGSRWLEDKTDEGEAHTTVPCPDCSKEKL